MQVTQVSASRGAALGAIGNREVIKPAAQPPLSVYRQALYVRLTLGTLAQAVRVDPSQTLLAGTFEHLDYNAVTVAEPELRATLSVAGDGVVVDLKAPRRISGVSLQPGKLSGWGHTLELYRLDGDTPADKPSATATITSGKTVARRADQATDAMIVFAGPSRSMTMSRDGVLTGVGTRTGFGWEDRSFALDFTDRRFLVRLKDDGDAVPLSASDLEAISVRALASGPRLGLAVPADAAGAPEPAGAVFFWRAAGEIGGNLPLQAGQFDLGQRLADDLERALGRWVEALRASGATSLPEQVDLAIVAESDAPCVLNVTGFRIAYQLVTTALDSGEGKQVLRFPEPSPVQTVSLTLPGRATVISADLRTDESVRSDRPALPSGMQATHDTLSGSAGVRLDRRRRAAQRFAPASAMSASAVALAVMALEPDAALAAALVEDVQGQPVGKTLAEGTLALPHPGRSTWFDLPLDAPVLLSSTPCWLVLSAKEGSIVWLCAAGAEDLCLLEVSAATAADIRTVPGLSALFVLSSPDASEVSSPVRLSVAGTPVSSGAQSGHYDLSAALNAYLAGQPLGAAVTVALEFVCTTPGTVTVYAPEVAYSI